MYIAGPLNSSGNVARNIRVAVKLADELWGLDFVPYVPHLSHFHDLICEHPPEEWIKFDLYWLHKCDCLFRIEGESWGADIEVEEARSIMPVFKDIQELLAWRERLVASEKDEDLPVRESEQAGRAD